MSSDQEVEPLEFEYEGLSFVKSFREDTSSDFPMVVYRITSNRDEDVALRIVEELPSELGFEAIGFHPSHGAEDWTGNDEQIVYTKTIQSDEEIFTVYGLKDFENYSLSPDVFITEPEINITDVGSGSNPTETVSGTTPDQQPSQDENIDPTGVQRPQTSDDDSSSEEDEEVGHTDPSEASGDGKARDIAEEVVSQDRVNNTEPSEDFYREDSLSAELATELKQGSIDKETEHVLGNEVERVVSETTQGRSSSTDVRVRYLQQRFMQLESYIDAIEEFIDGSGTAEELINTTKERLGRVEGNVSDLVDEAEIAAGERREMEEEIGDLEDFTDKLETRIDQLDERLGKTNDHLNDVDERVQDVSEKAQSAYTYADDIADRIEKARDELEGLSTEVEELTSATEKIEEDVDGLDSRLSDVTGQVDTVRERVSDTEEEAEEAYEKAESAEESVDEVQKRVGWHSEDIDDLAGSVEELESELSDVTDTLEEVADQSDEEVREELEEVREALTTMEAKMEDHKDAITTVDNHVDEVEEKVNSRVAEVEEEVENVSDNVDEVQEVDERMDELEGQVSDLSDRLSEVENVVSVLSDAFSNEGDDS